MKAVIQSAYGKPEEVLSVQEVDKPVPKDNEVLVEVRAASMHPDVWHMIVGVPLVARLMGNGVRVPKLRIPGTDFAGVVVAAGKNVSRFKAGDEVFGESVKFGWLNGGAYAEYVAVSQDWIASKPGNVSFEQAATVPTAGTIALMNLGGIQRPKRQSVVINGAGGCTGAIALQIAKADGAHVTAVDCAAKLPLLRSLGADRVIDYQTDDYLQNGERYDFIMDVAAFRSPVEYQRALKPGGEYIPIGHTHFNDRDDRMLGHMPRFIGLLLKAMLEPEKRKRMKARMTTKAALLKAFRELLDSGKLAPVIGQTYPLTEVVAAMKGMQEGKIIGRSILLP